MSPVFQYSPYDNSRFGATIAELLAHQGDIRARQALTVGEAQARAAEQSGNAWGQAIGNIGQTIAAIPQQIQQAKQQQQQSAYQQAQLEAQRELARQRKVETDQGIADRKALDDLFAQPGGIDEVLNRTPGHLRSKVIEDRKDLETYKRAQREDREKARQSQQNYFGRLGVSIRRNEYDPAWMLGALHDARQEYADDPAILKQIDAWREQTINDPASMHQVVDAAIGQSSFADELKPKAPIEVSPGASLVDPVTRKPLYQVPDRPQRPVSVSPGATLIDPATGKALYTAPPQEPTLIPVTEIDPQTGEIVTTLVEKKPGEVSRKPPKEPTQGQYTTASYAGRIEQAEDVLGNLGPNIAKMNYVSFIAQSRLPAAAQSGTFQSYDQAARNFVNAVLRRESGAAISESEFENARRQYLPQSGDTSETLAQKKANRDYVLRTLKTSAGRAYEPPIKVPEPTDKATTPKVGDVRTAHGETRKWNGTMWELVKP
jgi:hypothetical protein